MVKYRVEKIFVENFKRIKREEIVLQPITALVGGNTSGKSSVLQAAQLCVSLMQASFTEIKKGKVTRLSTLANEAVSYRPTDVLLTLRHSVPVSEAESVSETESVQTKPVQAKPVQTKSFSIGFTCTQIDDNGVETLLQLTVSVTRGKNANLALDYKGDESLIAVLGNRDQPFSIFTPGLSGIPLKEEWRTRGALDAAAMHGDANLYLRTLLDHLLRKDMTADIVTHWCKQKIDLDKLPASAPWSIFLIFWKNATQLHVYIFTTTVKKTDSLTL